MLLLKQTPLSRAAFTLVETILAITIIGLIITAAAQLTQSSIKIGRNTIDEFVAFHLAEEGVEVVKVIRDSNWLQNKAWRNNLDDGLYAIAEGLPWTLQPISGVGKLAAENFSRIIKISSVPDTKTMLITSTVAYFSKKGEERKVSLSAELTDWKKGPL